MENNSNPKPKKGGKFLKTIIVIVSAVFFFTVLVSIFGSPNSPSTGSGDPALEDQKRWDRGEFTEEEKAEIRAEEEREDKAKEELLKQIQGN